jgi:uncharacterized protein (DUF2236 family)
MTWQDFGSYRFHLMLSQAFLLQAAHPVIDAGVGEHSTYRTDPWGRAKRSTAMLWPVVYARPDIAIRKGRELRELHKAIRGVDKEGKKYSALDPEAYAWVHVTGFDSVVRMHEIFGEPLTPEQRAKAFEEWRQIGSMLGIKEKDIPQTEAEYWAYFNGMIDQKLFIGDVVKDLVSDRYYYEQPKPPVDGLSDATWKLALRIIGPWMRMNTIGTLPKRFRDRFDIPWTANDERLFQAHVLFFRILFRLLPFEKKYIPMAVRAFRDAKKHPDAYVYDPSMGGVPAPALS